jgi:hypothetical protein
MIVGKRTIPLAQVGPAHAILVEPTEAEQSQARIEVIINNRVSTTQSVFLYDGIKPHTKRVKFF